MKLFCAKQFGRVRTEIWDRATGQLVKSSPWKHNLAMDIMLNTMATTSANSGFAVIFSKCLLGSSSFPNSISTPGITFTQAGTTVTASGGFFTNSMVGSLLKYGVGSAGAEVYITNFTNTTTVTVATSLTVSTPIVGTIWNVQLTALVTPIGVSTSTYSGSGGANTTTFSTNQIVLQRTFVFAPQGGTINVNEIGYAPNGFSGNNVAGRFVLSATDSISPTQFYVVVIEMTWNVSPGSPAAVLNVGTGINTAGQAMFQFWDCQIVSTDGSTGHQQGNPSDVMDDFNNVTFTLFTGSSPTLNASPATGNAGTSAGISLGGMSGMSNTSQPVGVGQSTLAFSVSTSGQTVSTFMVGHGSGSFNTGTFLLNLTTPFVLPTGTFAGSIVFQNQFTRNLIN